MKYVATVIFIGAIFIFIYRQIRSLIRDIRESRNKKSSDEPKNDTIGQSSVEGSEKEVHK